MPLYTVNAIQVVASEPTKFIKNAGFIMTETINPDTLKALILEAMPDAEVHVSCYSGDDHFEMEVASASFAGKTRIAQHKMVYAALGDNMRAAVHALALKTRVE